MAHRRLPRDTSSWSNRFWELVDTRNSRQCWPWLGRRNKYERGIFNCSSKHKNFVVPRLIWLLSTGDDPGNKNVLHRCDNPWCCNPHHLWLGTQKQNVHDMIAKGRKWLPTGEKHGRAKLTESKVKAIRNSNQSNDRLAYKYGVSDVLISLVKRRQIWKHVA